MGNVTRRYPATQHGMVTTIACCAPYPVAFPAASDRRPRLDGGAPAALRTAETIKMKSAQRSLLVKQALTGLLLGVGVVPASLASDLGGQRSFQFADPNQRLVQLNTLDLRERKRGGAFQFNTTNNIDRQINCNFTVTATGNAASPTHAGAGIAPVGMQGSGLNATTTGNQAQADNSASGVNSNVTGSITPDRANAGPVSVGGDLSVGATGRGGFPTLAELANASASVGNPIRLDGNSQLNSGSHAANGTNVNQVGQSNTGSTLTSGINNSPTTVSLGNISADGAQILNTVDTSQSINDTQVAANVDGSRACDFVETQP